MEKKLFLIDGHALIFKMYYAFLRHPMINSKGADMSVLFGFTKYVLELIEKEKPTHLAIAFDPPGGTFRHEMYPEYKGTRSETPQLIIDSLEPLCELCKAMDFPVLMVKGFEADDVIGSMAKRAEKEGFKVFMVTPDKDYGQLISENILQYKPGKSGSDNEIIDVQKVCEKYNITRPEQVIEILTICGDSSDNVPGVKGVGEVGAGKLVSKFGTVEEIYKNLDELTPKQREAFVSSEGHIMLSHELVTIKTDIVLDVDSDSMELTATYSPEAADLFEKYEFGSLKRYLGNIQTSTPKEAKQVEFTENTSAQVVKEAMKLGKCAIITEAVGEGIFSGIARVTVAAGTMTAEGQADDFAQIIADPQITKYGYDLKLQRNLLAHAGIRMEGTLMDIELMHYLINPEKTHKIEILAKTYLDVNLEESESTTEAVETLSLFDEIPEDEAKPSKAKEAAVLFMLGEAVWKDMESNEVQSLYMDMEEPLLKVLSDMEMEGVKIDLAQLRKYSSALSAEMETIQGRIREMAQEPALNIMSPKQIGPLLFEKLRLDPKMKPKSGRYTYPTDEETLSALADKHPIINEILEFRGVKKLLSTYIEPFPGYISSVTGKVHTTFNQALTATGRLSSSKPNLQNIPIRTDRGKEIRKAFVPSRPDGLIVSADYSQIELRIMAHLSCDKHLIEAFRAGQDVHAITASRIFGIPLGDVTSDQRRIAKTANFGIMYGISSFGLAQRLKIGRGEAKKIIEDYFANFPAISSYIEDTLTAARENGYVETIFGRKRYLPDINSRNGTVRALAERNAINAPIQGTSADIIKLAMIKTDRRIKQEGLQSRMILQIHDELVFDTTPDEVERLEAIVREEMENVIELSIPLTVECNHGHNWLEAH
ncbi:MAG: DNA polymerase I [Bacteroidales bacterium]|nr:DNA polymerase I [Bacteroidales bacterium]MBR5862630.1 DNA polymerase I [Bacteroidales bacterium]